MSTIYVMCQVLDTWLYVPLLYSQPIATSIFASSSHPTSIGYPDASAPCPVSVDIVQLLPWLHLFLPGLGQIRPPNAPTFPPDPSKQDTKQGHQRCHTVLQDFQVSVFANWQSQQSPMRLHHGSHFSVPFVGLFQGLSGILRNRSRNMARSLSPSAEDMPSPANDIDIEGIGTWFWKLRQNQLTLSLVMVRSFAIPYKACKHTQRVWSWTSFGQVLMIWMSPTHPGLKNNWPKRRIRKFPRPAESASSAPPGKRHRSTSMVQQWGSCIRQRHNDSTRFLPLYILMRTNGAF